MAIVSMASKDVKRAKVIAARIGDSFLTGVLASVTIASVMKGAWRSFQPQSLVRIVD